MSTVKAHQQVSALIVGYVKAATVHHTVMDKFLRAVDVTSDSAFEASLQGLHGLGGHFRSDVLAYRDVELLGGLVLKTNEATKNFAQIKGVACIEAIQTDLRTPLSDVVKLADDSREYTLTVKDLNALLDTADAICTDLEKSIPQAQKENLLYQNCWTHVFNLFQIEIQALKAPQYKSGLQQHKQYLKQLQGLALPGLNLVSTANQLRGHRMDWALGMCQLVRRALKT